MAQGISRRHFFYGTLLAGTVPGAGFGSVASLKRLGVDSAAALLAILRRVAGKPEEEERRREAYAEGETAAEGVSRAGEEWRKAEEAEPSAAAPEPEAGEEEEGERPPEEGEGAEFAEGGYQQVSRGAGAKKPGFVEQWRTYEGMIPGREGVGGVPRALSPEEKRAEAARVAAEEKARAERAAALAAQTGKRPMAPPRRRTYEPNAHAQMARYFKNARALVPGPVTLLLWIYT